MAITLQPPTLPWQASGTSFISSRRMVNIATKSETPVALFRATSKNICWDIVNAFCWTGQSLVLSAYADPTITNPGQSQMPVNLRIGSATQATAVVTNDPAASNYGTYLASSQMLTPSNLLIVIDPGHTLLVTATVSNANVSLGLGFSWYELIA